MGNTQRQRERERERERERVRVRDILSQWSLRLCDSDPEQTAMTYFSCLSLSLSVYLSGVKSIRGGCSSLYSTGTSGKLSPALLWIHAVKHKADLLLQSQTKTQSEAWFDGASKKAWAGFI